MRFEVAVGAWQAVCQLCLPGWNKTFSGSTETELRPNCGEFNEKKQTKI
jgi:hypothetical protein